MDNRQGLSELSEKSVNLIISDPPYFEVKGEFDFVWKDFTEYLGFMEQQAQLYKRVLADNGTIYVYGDAKNIAYVQVIFDRYFTLLNNLVWENTNDHKQQIRFNPDLRTFAPLTERILVYEKSGDKTGGELIFEQFLKPQNPFSKYLREEFKIAGLNNKEVSKLFPSRTGGLTGCVSNWLNGDNVITEEQYLKIREFTGGKFLRKEYEELRKEYEELRKEYEELRKEYEELRRPFNNERHYGDVIRMPNYETADYEHETIKPEKLTRELILISSKPNDIVCVPFAGSGTECAMAAKEKRLFVGFETNLDHVMTARKRVADILSQPELF